MLWQKTYNAGRSEGPYMLSKETLQMCLAALNDLSEDETEPERYRKWYTRAAEEVKEELENYERTVPGSM